MLLATPEMRRAARGLRLLWWAWLAHEVIYLGGHALWQRMWGHSSSAVMGLPSAAMTAATLAVRILAVLALVPLVRAGVRRAKLALGMQIVTLVVGIAYTGLSAWLSRELSTEATAAATRWWSVVGVVVSLVNTAAFAAALASLARVRGTIRPGWIVASAALSITTTLAWVLAPLANLEVWIGQLAWAEMGSVIVVFIPFALILWKLSSPRGLVDPTQTPPRTLGPEWRRAVNGLDTYALALWLQLGLFVAGFVALLLAWWLDSASGMRLVAVVTSAGGIFLSLAFIVGLVGWSSMPRTTGAVTYVKASVGLSALLIMVQIAFVAITLRLLSGGLGVDEAEHAQAQLILLEAGTEILGLAAMIALLGSFRIATLAVGEDDLAQRATRLWLATLILAFVVLGFRWGVALGILEPANLFVTVAVVIVFLAAALFGSYVGFLADLRRTLRARLS